MSLLAVEGLRVDIGAGGRVRQLLHDVTFSVERGMILGIVGETGAGKTMVMRSLLDALPAGATMRSDTMAFDGRSLPAMSAKQRAQLRARRFGVVVQNPIGALPPHLKVGRSVGQMLSVQGLASGALKAQVLEAFASVGLADPEGVARLYPHELSGGMAQRVLIAAAFAKSPDLVIADEPTTALDVTVQRQILDLLKANVEANHTGAIVVTHDIGVVAEYCTDVLVMYAGKEREQGTVVTVLTRPTHPYTMRLLDSTNRWSAFGGHMAPHPSEIGCEYIESCPIAEADCATSTVGEVSYEGVQVRCRIPDAAAALDRVGGVSTDLPARFTPSAPDAGPIGPDPGDDGTLVAEAVLSARGIEKFFRQRGGRTAKQVLRSVDMHLAGGETLAIVGESGAGKSTFGRILLNLTHPDQGTVTYRGRVISGLSEKQFRPLRREIQIVYQDPVASLDSRLSVRRVISEPLTAFKIGGGREERNAMIERLLGEVGLSADFADRLSSSLSGGQRQRVAIARALAPGPDVVLLDEPTASLDLTVRSQILDLLARIQQDRGVAYLLISHDLSSVRTLAKRVMVMRAGEVVEEGECSRVLSAPSHPYTRALLAAELSKIPRPADGGRRELVGQR